MTNLGSKASLALAVLGMIGAASGVQAADKAGAELIAATCGTCHTPAKDGSFPRISSIRKTPEGWDMTISRMERWHQLQITEADRAAIVKYLADTQGLAPEEAKPFRYALERRPGVTETHADAELGDFCARCHSMARPGLQRRDAAEWKKLIHTHVGQWPTLEFHAKSRDRDWWNLANGPVKDKLGKTWPLLTKEWKAWKGHATPDLSGTWKVAGAQPGKGAYAGTMTVKKAAAPDTFEVAYDLAFADGAKLTGGGKSLVYTGYEWRGNMTLGGKEVREVLAVGKDGQTLAGRWFEAAQDEIGGDMKAVKVGTAPTLVSVMPSAAKLGSTVTLTLAGANMSGAVDLGKGVSVTNQQARPDGSVTVTATVTDKAAKGPRDVVVGGAKLASGLVVYDSVDAVKVEPPYTIARIGGAGGPIPNAPAQFEAVAYMKGKDGKPGTKDDIRIGVMPAKWQTEDFDEAAKALKDAEFAGVIDGSGLFTPGDAGMNPKRAFQTNNVGNLKVKATVDDAGKPVTGEAQLIVTVQRWVDGWIR